MELWQAVTAVSGAVVALVVGGGAVVGFINRPFAKLREKISDVRTEGHEAHKAIGTNIDALGVCRIGLVSLSNVDNIRPL